jgi:pSer/pThr/pTyr-binding forkhead associated (FHA) protein
LNAFVLRAASASELKDELEAMRCGLPFLICRDSEGQRQIIRLESERDRLTIGRSSDNDLQIPWDPSVSRTHAQLKRLGSAWTLTDEGLSRNGSYVNGTRVSGRRRLRDGDAIRLGATVIVYRAGLAGHTDPTLVELSPALPPALSPIQRRVLLALARPCQDPASLNTPASNQQIARELSYSVDAVKAHLRTLFHKFGVDALPQGQKRLKLVEQAFSTGAISPLDL